jgi:hypothetical protein
MNRCLGCTERHEGCHSTCEDYLEYKKTNEDRKRVIRDKKEKNREINQYKQEHRKKRREF